jgi:hypothetical protein
MQQFPGGQQLPPQHSSLPFGPQNEPSSRRVHPSGFSVGSQNSHSLPGLIRPAKISSGPIVQMHGAQAPSGKQHSPIRQQRPLQHVCSPVGPQNDSSSAVVHSVLLVSGLQDWQLFSGLTASGSNGRPPISQPHSLQEPDTQHSPAAQHRPLQQTSSLLASQKEPSLSGVHPSGLAVGSQNSHSLSGLIRSAKTSSSPILQIHGPHD